MLVFEGIKITPPVDTLYSCKGSTSTRIPVQRTECMPLLDTSKSRKDPTFTYCQLLQEYIRQCLNYDVWNFVAYQWKHSKLWNGKHHGQSTALGRTVLPQSTRLWKVWWSCGAQMISVTSREICTCPQLHSAHLYFIHGHMCGFGSYLTELLNI